MSLNIENLTVESFATATLVDQEQTIGGDSVAPYCIVYISDCVACL